LRAASRSTRWAFPGNLTASTRLSGWLNSSSLIDSVEKKATFARILLRLYGGAMQTTIVIFALALLQGTLCAQPAPFDPNSARPSLWDERELNKIPLPPALPEGKILYLPSDAYYKLKPLPIYKTYPVYASGHEPKGYFDDLRLQEPEVMFDPQ